MGIMVAAGLILTFSESLVNPNVSLTSSSFSYSGSSVSGSVSVLGSSGVGSLFPSYFLQEKLSPKSAMN